MNYEIEVSYEEERNCGHRHSGPDGVGLYLVGNGMFEPCERMPFPLTTCPCCGAGIKFSRGFTWIDPTKLFAQTTKPCTTEHDAGSPYADHHHKYCPMCSPQIAGNRAGLLWVGDKNYTPEDFTIEAMRMGVSRRIASVPNDFVVGKHVIYLAHIKAVPFLNDDGEMDGNPGVFFVFRPSRVDIVVDVDKPEQLPDRAKRIKDRMGDSARIIKVVPLTGDVTEGEEDE